MTYDLSWCDCCKKSPCDCKSHSNSAVIDGLDAIRSVLKEADYQDCFLADDEIIKTIRDTVQLAQQSKKLLADIKAWDVQTFLENSKFTMPQDLRKRIHDISGS
jgi:hypothetical protein